MLMLNNNNDNNKKKGSLEDSVSIQCLLYGLIEKPRKRTRYCTIIFQLRGQRGICTSENHQHKEFLACSNITTFKNYIPYLSTKNFLSSLWIIMKSTICRTGSITVCNTTITVEHILISCTRYKTKREVVFTDHYNNESEPTMKSILQESNIFSVNAIMRFLTEVDLLDKI